MREEGPKSIDIADDFGVGLEASLAVGLEASFARSIADDDSVVWGEAVGDELGFGVGVNVIPQVEAQKGP